MSLLQQIGALIVIAFSSVLIYIIGAMWYIALNDWVEGDTMMPLRAKILTVLLPVAILITGILLLIFG